MSAAGKRGTENFPTEWSRLERAVEDATGLLGHWVRRAREAEEEVERLRRSLEDVVGERTSPDDAEQQLRRLKAENAALQSRMLQARKRVAVLLQRLAALEVQP